MSWQKIGGKTTKPRSHKQCLKLADLFVQYCRLKNTSLVLTRRRRRTSTCFKDPRKQLMKAMKFGKTTWSLVNARLVTRWRSCLSKQSSPACIQITQSEGGGGNRGINLPSPYFLSQFVPPHYFFEPISPSSLNGYVSFSPSSLLFPPISPSAQLFWGHFSLLPILFLPPL